MRFSKNPLACLRRLSVCKRPATLLLGALLLCLGVAPWSSAAELQLAGFNGSGFDWTWGDFNQTVGAESVRLQDLGDGWGGAGLSVVGADYSTLSDGRLVIDVIPQAGNGVDRFDIELIEQSGNGQTLKSGKWTFNLATLQPGVPATLVSTTTLSNPLGGVGDYQDLNLDQIQSWQILGEYGSPGPFDLRVDNVSISDSTSGPPPYAGAEPDAAWRSEAAARIDAIRKGDLRVSVVDAAGAPLPNASVRAVMKQHEFGFGSAVQAYRLSGDSSQHEQYQSKVAELFNLATLENNLKWPPWEGEWGPSFTQSGALSAIEWLTQQGIDARGHVMVWPGADNLPADLRQMLADDNLTAAEQQTVRNRIAAHIASQGAAVQNQLTSWDVINETRTNHDLMDELSEGDHAMVDWFEQASDAAPSTDLYINDYGILSSGGGTETANQDQYYETIQYLKNEGAPIDGIGFQGHFSDSDFTGPEQLWTILDRFEALGLKMQVTEFDIRTADESLQAQYTRDFLTAMFAHEGVSDVILWGFWEDAHWRPEAAMYRSDWSIKPNGEAYEDLVFGDWWTDEETVSDADGESTVRGYKGDYSVTASVAGYTEEVDVMLTGDGSHITITIPILTGDYNSDGKVDAADYSVWRDTLGQTGSALAADGDHDGEITSLDYDLWRNHYGNTLPSRPASAAPAPSAAALLLLTAAMQFLRAPRASTK